MFVDHKCKFSFYGCEIKMKLEQIVVHEETCLERTVTCPAVQCKGEVQLRKFNEHASKEGCAKPIIRFDIKNNFNQSLNFSLKMHSFKAHNLTFYFLSNYLASKKCLIFSVMLPEDVETASQYTVKITVTPDPDAQRKLIYEGSVLSIEDLPNIEDDKANKKYWFVSYDNLEPFLTQDRIPIQVEVF